MKIRKSFQNQIKSLNTAGFAVELTSELRTDHYVAIVTEESTGNTAQCRLYGGTMISWGPIDGCQSQSAAIRAWRMIWERGQAVSA